MQKLLSLLLLGSVMGTHIPNPTQIINDTHDKILKTFGHENNTLDTGVIDEVIERIHHNKLLEYYKAAYPNSKLDARNPDDEMLIMKNIFQLIIDRCKTNYISEKSAEKLFNLMHYVFKTSHRTDLLKTAFINNTESLIENLYYQKDSELLQKAIVETVKNNSTLASDIHKLVNKRGTLGTDVIK